LKNVSFSYGIGEKKALDNISLEINKGENDCINRFSCQRNTLYPEVGVHGCFAAIVKCLIEAGSQLLLQTDCYATY